MNIVIEVLGFIHNSTTWIKVNFGLSIQQFIIRVMIGVEC